MTSNHSLLERAAEVGTYGGAATTLGLWGLSVSEIAVTVSAVFAGLSFAVHLYFAWRRDRREQELHQSKMETKNAGKAPTED